MSNLSAVFTRMHMERKEGHAHTIDDRLGQGQAWAEKAYELLTGAGLGEGEGDPVCEAAWGAALFNLGMIKEVRDARP